MGKLLGRTVLALVGLVIALGVSPGYAQTASPKPGELGRSGDEGGTVPFKELEDREEPTRPGEQKYKYWEETGVPETVIDDEGKIYQTRHYGGVIPHVRDTLYDKKTSKPRRRGLVRVTWLGFQQKALFSRVFIQTDRLPTYTIFKPDPTHIVVELPTARLRTPQEGRDVITHEFNTSIDHIVAKRVKGRGVHVVITLKEPVGYLYKQDGAYIFVDVERRIVP